MSDCYLKIERDVVVKNWEIVREATDITIKKLARGDVTPELWWEVLEALYDSRSVLDWLWTYLRDIQKKGRTK